LRTFLFWVAPVLVGLGVALVIHLFVIFPTLGAGAPDVQRGIELGRRIEQGFAQAPSAVFIGDSVTVEGIDATVAQQAAPPGWEVLNLALNGGDRLEQAIMIPKLAQARPELVIWIVRPMLLGAPPANLHEDRAAAYRLGGFRPAWPDAWLSTKQGITRESLAMLEGSEIRAKVHFRTGFIGVVGVWLKGVLRPGTFRDAEPDDWLVPAELASQAPLERLQLNIKSLAEEHDKRVRLRTTDEQGRETITSRLEPQELFRLVDHLARSGTRVVLVRSPIHPEIRASKAFEPEATQLEEMARDWCASNGGLYLDAATLLEASEFADGQHPAASGRAKLSAFIGSGLPAPGTSSRGGGT
jgi:hypothetical protein